MYLNQLVSCTHIYIKDIKTSKKEEKKLFFSLDLDNVIFFKENGK